jgi:hypothetical protein
MGWREGGVAWGGVLWMQRRPWIGGGATERGRGDEDELKRANGHGGARDGRRLEEVGYAIAQALVEGMQELLAEGGVVTQEAQRVAVRDGRGGSSIRGRCG